MISATFFLCLNDTVMLMGNNYFKTWYNQAFAWCSLPPADHTRNRQMYSIGLQVQVLWLKVSG